VSPTPPPTVDHRDPAQLLEALVELPGSVLVGFEPQPDGTVHLLVGPLPEDDRAAAAGLFCRLADPSWCAVGVAVAGRTRHLHTREVVSEGVTAAVVVTRSGAVASRLQAPGRDAPVSDTDAPEGLVVDSLHRVLGLPAPGQPVPPSHLALTVWADRALQELLAVGHLDWKGALDLHPGDPGPGPIGPSIETLVEATVRSTEGFDWSDVHRRTAQGRRAGYDLTPDEAAWMDVTMFSRWVTGSLPDVHHALHVMDQHGCHSVADRIRRVGAALGVVDRG